MTDKQIKKALECCVNGQCEDCPFYTRCFKHESVATIALDLINRQQAEIKQAKTEARKEFAAELISALKIGEFSWFEEESEMLVEAINELAEGGR